MAKIAKVALMVKCKVNGKWRNLPAQISANGRLKVIPGSGSTSATTGITGSGSAKTQTRHWPQSAAVRFHSSESRVFPLQMAILGKLLVLPSPNALQIHPYKKTPGHSLPTTLP